MIEKPELPNAVPAGNPVIKHRTAVRFRSFPEGEDPQRVEIIVGLLLKGLHNEVLSVYVYTLLCSCETDQLVIGH